MNFGEFTKNEFLANLLYRNYDTITETCDGFEIYGSINIDNDSYITVVKNGVNGRKCGFDGPRTDQITCRISLFRPEYIQCDEKLTKEELQWFIDYTLRCWNIILDDNYELYHNWFNNKKYKRLHIPIPDYSLLSTLD